MKIPRRVKDLRGERFGLLIVFEYVGLNYGKAVWLCNCDCGMNKTAKGINLTTGKTRSCGCLRGAKPTHGRSGDVLYNIWRQMLYRCYNESAENYSNYGGRGIEVCKRWHNLELFCLDMGMPPTKEHTLDRIDNSAIYEPNNCRWATIKTQQRNKRTNFLVFYRGEKKPLVVWCEQFNLPYKKTWTRLRYRGWSVERAFTA